MDFHSNQTQNHLYLLTRRQLKSKKKKRERKFLLQRYRLPQKQRQKKKNKGGDEASDVTDSMDVEENATKQHSSSTTSGAATSTSGEQKTEITEEKKSVPEPDFEDLKNPTRVTWSQEQYVVYDHSQRYLPVKKHLSGIVLLRDTKPDLPEELVVQKEPKIGIPGVSDDEPAPPEPFEFRR